jgi:hypothetical protein
MHMIRPYQAMTHIADLEERLKAALPLLEQPNKPLPTPVLLERLRTTYSILAHTLPNAPEQVHRTLEIERRIVPARQATNLMPLVIPCHRVLGSDGKLHDYGGRSGLATKAWLLKPESRRQGAID